MLKQTIERLKMFAARLAPEFSWTNRTKQDKKGTIPLEGSASFKWGGDRTEIRLAWDLTSSFHHAGVRVDRHEPNVTFYAGFGPAFWLSFEDWRPRSPILNLCNRIEGDSGREIRVAVHDKTLWWRFWADPNCYSSLTPRWRDGSFNFADALLGTVKTTREIVDVREVEIPMPSGIYLGRSTIERVANKRPRWFAERFTTANITMDSKDDSRFSPIPHPGKGENSWDCDEDATYAMSCRASTHAEAIGEVVASVMRDRMKHGGDKWRPECGPFGSKAGGGGPGGSDDDPPKEFNPETDSAMQAAREKLRRAMRPAPEETDDNPQAASSMPSDAEPLATATGGALDAWARFHGTNRWDDEDDDALRARLFFISEPAPTPAEQRVIETPGLRAVVRKNHGRFPAFVKAPTVEDIRADLLKNLK